MQIALSFPSRGGFVLDGVLSIPDQSTGPFPSVALCHPEPNLDGHLDEPLIKLTAEELNTRGIASLRFTYRGIDENAEVFQAGEQPLSDVRSAIKLLRRWKGLDKRIGIMGYSLGAAIACTASLQDKSIKALALASPNMTYFPKQRLYRIGKPTLLVTGAKDNITPSAWLEKVANELQAEHQKVPESDHSFQNHHEAVARNIAKFFSRTLFTQ